MKAVQVIEYHTPVHVTEVPEPVVAHPLDVVVRIAGAGICRTDLHILEGQLADAFHPVLPYTLGHENAGYVAEVGSAVSWLAPGDPVIVHPAVTCGFCTACRSGDDMHCPTWRFPGVDGWGGGYAEYMLTSARSLVKLPAGADPAAMAPHADAGLTAIHAVKRLAPHLRPGSTVAMIGFGGLGHLAIQLLRLYTTARVVVVDNSAERLKWAETFGPDAVFESVADMVARTGGVDAVLDLVGEHDVPREALAALRKGGVYSIVGYGGGTHIDFLDMINRELTVLGNQIGTHTELTELMNLAARDRIRLEVRRFPLEEVAHALDEVAAGRVLGRAVLVP
ncbi:NAD(P)-dependent alcohol dehydrogenase [Planotetraspora sp. A-T 1434]|uniref:NAD(P)-dependent alcohol dehydrogenase n=1 Tax=Planotetraspora sp. A-T 1434 TaxID=2979219 RepID=UPI0021C0261C|nr:NAD(P)-dependent alcohol dehydrogenase [Planotetraspora sp. A-T 1434]MCT9929282.1 NAD(P)-dependent alcohol dehydrogenase [Planotetraspora sp. A-T 1434]